MPSVIDVNAIATSVYKTVLTMNQSATQLVGLDAMWCRLLPYDNGEDVIVQEYTLHQYECPRAIKVVTSNSDYGLGNFSIDLFGMHRDVPLEVSIDINTWKSVYGENTMPQKGDFILIQLLHQPYQVETSTVIYTIGEQPTSYKCQLGIWRPNANRKVTEEFKISMDELTESQDRLFGDVISKEVADAVVERETAYDNTTMVDKIKDFDISSVVEAEGDIIGLDGNVISGAYYDFIDMRKPVEYRVSAKYDKNVDENHWIFSCWFRSDGDDNELETSTLKLGQPYLKEKDYWYIKIDTPLTFQIDEQITIYRGNSIKLNGVVCREDGDTQDVIKILSSECMKVSKKFPNWWKGGIWKVQRQIYYNLLTCYDGDMETMRIDINGNNIYLRRDGMTLQVGFTPMYALDLSDWHYIALDFSATQTDIILVKTSEDKTGQHHDKVMFSQQTQFTLSAVSFDHAGIYAQGMPVQMTNIRLYENAYPLGDNYKTDMYSRVTKNASKLIIVDSPNASNDMTFVTDVR